MSSYDKELINSRIIEVCDYFISGESRAEGYKRRIWNCPECGGDNFAANTEQEIAGCFSPSCDVPQTTNAIGIIAYFEGYEMKGRSFVECLKRGYEILGIPEPEDDGGKGRLGISSNRSSGSRQTSKGGASSNASATATVESPDTKTAAPLSPPSSPAALKLRGVTMPAAGEAEEGQPSRDLLHRVYEAWMRMCPLVEDHREFWHRRGVTDDTIQAGGFGSLSRDRCLYLLSSLRERFGMEALLTVPGFKRGPNGELRTNLFGEYTLIPYYDRDGYITTIEGRVPGEPEGKAPKYMAPVGAGSHLYVFPSFKPEHVMAFCEGLMGAVIAAQNGIAVASIKGCRCFRRSPAGKGKPYRVLAELAGVDFGGRALYYIPDLDVKEKTRAEVEKAAPQAARWLIEKQNGTAYLARLPEGADDLDKWLLSMEEFERVTEFVKLTQQALTPAQWKGDATPEPQKAAEAADDSAEAPAEPVAGSELGDAGAAEDANPSSEGISTHSAGEKPASGDRTGDSEGRHNGGSRNGTSSREQYEQERRRIAAEQEQQTSSPPSDEQQDTEQGTGPAEPRRYKPIPGTNFGEFMVGLIYGGVTGIAFLMFALFAAPELEPTSAVTRVPVPITVVVSLIIAVVVLRIICRRLYVRRWRALQHHLSGKQ